MAFSLLKLGFFIVCVCVCNIKSTIHPSGWLWMMMMMLAMVWTMSPPRQFFLVKKKNNHPYTIEFFFLNPCVLDKSFFFWLEFKKNGYTVFTHNTQENNVRLWCVNVDGYARISCRFVFIQIEHTGNTFVFHIYPIDLTIWYI